MSDYFRGRRLRKTQGLRELVRETEVRAKDLIQPYFVLEGSDAEAGIPIPSMPGQEQLGIRALIKRIGAARGNGLRSVILFGIPERKDERGSQAYARDGIIQKAVAELKAAFPELTDRKSTRLNSSHYS